MHRRPTEARLLGMSASFLVNLRALTIAPDFDDVLRPKGYLAAPASATAATRKFAASRPRGRTVVVDNGRYDDIGRIAAALASQAQAVQDQLRAARLNAGADFSLRDLPAAGRAQLDALLGQLAAAVSQAPGGEALADQLAYRPEAVVGEEDIWAACVQRLGLDTTVIPRLRQQIRARNDTVAARAASVVADQPPGRKPGRFAGPAARGRGPDTWYLPVASAVDYDSAFDAGRIVASSGARSAALGFGAFMADDSYVTTYRRGGRTRRLPGRMPARYLRTALVARGLWDGWAAAAGGGAPLRFHFLGLGAPIMLGIAAVAGHATEQLTFDATSPIRDASEGSLYLCDPAPLKVRTRSLAARLAAQEGFSWPCRCPFCVSYLTSRPFDLAAAAAWRLANPDRPIVAPDLRPPSALARALPLLSEPSAGPERKAIEKARVGHNHWVLQTITARLNRHSSKREDLISYQARVIRNYSQTTNSAQFATAVDWAFRIVCDA